ncbi:glycosyltransferase [Natrarchaeobius sp. A-rgal3]|uniref:glycosyltransferase n=1 Tax=Natrarchaeobius versutus TaxID=1679078 RepID=UPI00350FFA43
MNVLYFVNRFPKLSESFIINEIHELERRGHQVAVFSLRQPEIDLQHEEVAHLDAPVGYLPDPSVGSGLRTPGRWCLDQRVLRRLVHTAPPVAHAGSAYIAGHCIRFVQSLEFDIDHVHGHFLNWPKLASDYVSSHFEVPCTTTAHAYDLYSEPNERLLRLLADRMDRVVTISEYNRRYLHNDIGTDSPVDIVHMGIDPSKFQPSGSIVSGRILTVARFEEKKGISYGIDAIGRIKEVLPDLEYHLVGSGEREDVIRDQIAKYGLEDIVSILGHVSDERLIRELDEAEVFLLPCVIASDGDRDGIPVALMEAMAMETVPISTRVSGIPELITHGENGLLVDPGDVDGLAQVLREYFTGTSTDVAQHTTRDRILAEFDVRECATELTDAIRDSARKPN